MAQKSTPFSIWTFANPARFMALSGVILPWAAGLTGLCAVVGLAWALFATEPDFRQGETIKIFFLHVPSAVMAINIYFVMVVASIIGLIRRHPVSHLVAKASAPIGAVFTLLAIVTGALWGQPIWGTWWAWDARLTSVLILFFFYLGYLALWEAVEDFHKAADLAAILCVVGSVFAVLSRYAVEIWATLHQGSSLSLDAEKNIDDAYYTPLLIMIAAFYLAFVTLLLIGVRTEIRAQRIRRLRIAEAA